MKELANKLAKEIINADTEYDAREIALELLIEWQQDQTKMNKEPDIVLEN